MKIASIAAVAAILFAPAAVLAQGGEKKDIVAVASGAGQFSTLIAAVKAAGLVETLQGKGPFEALLADKEKLAAILKYHVVSGKVMAGDIIKMGGAKPATVNGDAVDITLRDGKVYVDGARVVAADVGASNGVIHVIDSVILPGPSSSGSK